MSKKANGTERYGLGAARSRVTAMPVVRGPRFVSGHGRGQQPASGSADMPLAFPFIGGNGDQPAK